MFDWQVVPGKRKDEMLYRVEIPFPAPIKMEGYNPAYRSTTYALEDKKHWWEFWK